jgi:surfactin synthase thioesterase subunit
LVTNVRDKPEWIRRFHKSRSADLTPLLIFPHAGTGASWYREYSKALSKNFEVIVFQYPGRQDRADEPALTSLQDIAAGAFAEFQASAHNRGFPILTFGHSMGALVSFEFVRLAEAAGIQVRQMTIAAAVAPHRAADKPSAPQDDQELLNHLNMLGGTTTDVFASSELLRMTLPIVKADHRAAETYSCPPTVTVAAKIHALGGDQDPIVTMADLYGWRQHSENVEITMFDGGHFFLTDHISAIGELLATSRTAGHHSTNIGGRQ